ncbi:glycosyltransferase family 2 protein [Niallia endozanthoxylica]|uniref:Glycosyltransferase family 2 protein n=1 Tax=Niallia endozanthoxylica TaxID=2036016 RepID=A0A5J5GZY9_9BACI|nr:glycosyltransferase family 2 protein [Niallia endozanthoxylica]KAA9013821.1 glycosyltransferase family 2 protein [Niallia endozanthoxylica]
MQDDKYDFIFIVLTYRNTKDLSDFIITTKNNVKNSYKIIVVNSYYDEESCKAFNRIANENECDFLNVENKGYGYGNNRGIEFAKKKYDFNYLIISNPDIEINSLSISDLVGTEDYIIAPKITTLNGKNQNPYYYSKIELFEWLIYFYYKSGNRLALYVSLILNKLYRELNLFIDWLLRLKRRKIYAAHGSFLIIGHSALEKLGSLYDEKMFLFCEENHLARLANSKHVKTYMIPSISVLHKEDGSVGLEKNKSVNPAKESYIVYYENWKRSSNN